jgi:hypothetical protein
MREWPDQLANKSSLVNPQSAIYRQPTISESAMPEAL